MASTVCLRRQFVATTAKCATVRVSWIHGPLTGKQRCYIRAKYLAPIYRESTSQIEQSLETIHGATGALDVKCSNSPCAGGFLMTEPRLFDDDELLNEGVGIQPAQGLDLGKIGRNNQVRRSALWAAYGGRTRLD